MRCSSSSPLVRVRVVAVVACHALALSGSGIARAADAGQAAAVVLQDRGIHLMAQGKTKEGCVALTESSRLDPSPETFLALATCHERLLTPAAAWSDLKNAQTYARSSGNRSALAEAQSKLAVLEPTLFYIKVVVPPAKNVPGLHVSLDGIALNEGAWDTFLPVDPGAHEITAEAPGHARTTYQSTTDAVDRKRIVTVEIDEQRGLSGSETHLAEPGSRVIALGSSPSSTPHGHRSGSSIGPIASGLVGMTALAGGIGFALAARLEWQDYQSTCPHDQCRSQAGIDSAHAAALHARLADVSFGVGVAASALAVYLMMRHHQYGVEDQERKRAQLVPSVSRDAAGFSLQGLW